MLMLLIQVSKKVYFLPLGLYEDGIARYTVSQEERNRLLGIKTEVSADTSPFLRLININFNRPPSLMLS